MKKISLLITLAIVYFLSACNSELLYKDYVLTSLSSYVFSADAEEELTVFIETNEDKEWTFTPSEDWIVCLKNGDGNLTILVQGNSSGEERTGTVVLKSGSASETIMINQLAIGGNISVAFNDLPLTSRSGFSRNGKYIGYIEGISNNNGSWDYKAWRLSTETGEKEQLVVPSFVQEGNNIPLDQITWVSNDGRSIVYAHLGNEVTMLYRDGNKVDLPIPAGCSGVFIQAMSADGNTLVGYTYNTMRDALPAVWRNGQVELLEMPEYNSEGMEVTHCQVRGCSDDGTVVYGTEWRTFSLVYWKDGKLYDQSNTESLVNVRQMATSTSMSPNGKYIAAYYSSGTGIYSSYPVMVNTEDHTSKSYPQFAGAEGYHATDNGDLFAGAPLSIYSSSIIEAGSDTPTPVQEWFKENYDLEIPNNRNILYFSPEAKFFYGFKMLPNGMTTIFPVSWYLKF